jgi:hypothetical protein
VKIRSGCLVQAPECDLMKPALQATGSEHSVIVCMFAQWGPECWVACACRPGSLGSCSFLKVTWQQE